MHFCNKICQPIPFQRSNCRKNKHEQTKSIHIQIQQFADKKNPHPVYRYLDGEHIRSTQLLLFKKVKIERIKKIDDTKRWLPIES